MGVFFYYSYAEKAKTLIYAEQIKILSQFLEKVKVDGVFSS